MKMILIFAVATILNVILSTVRSLCTVNSGKVVAAIANAVCYGFYTYVIVITVSDINLWAKIGITALANFVGVYIVKLIEEKARKDKLWLVKITVPKQNFETAKDLLKIDDIPYSYIDIEKYIVFDTYCKTQKQTAKVLDICEVTGGKAFATESKI